MAEQNRDNVALADVVERFVKRSGLSYAQIARKAGLSNKTVISNWINGYSKRPRYWDDLVRFAQALALSESETDEVLTAGGHEPIILLRERATTQEARDLLAYWKTQPHSLFQVPHPDVREFVGRQQAQHQIRQALLDNQSICAIVGMGGLGKSTLAQQVAYQLRNQYPDGVLWARVNGVVSLMEILRSFAAAYGRDVSEYSDRDTRSRIVRELLADKKALIILDDIESSTELKTLLPPIGTCAVLVTTRNRQAVSNIPATRIELETFTSAEGLQLFRSYLGQTRVDDEAAEAQALVDYVGGLPLAIRIMASTLNQADYLTLYEYAQLLANRQQRLDYLEDWEDETKVMRAVIAVSTEQLSAEIQTLFTKLAVFEGLDFSVAAVAAIAEISTVQAKLGLGRLAALSLINALPIGEADLATSAQERLLTERYHCHILIHLFAREQLGKALASVRRRAADYYAEFAYQHGSNHRYQWLDLEWPNIAAALRWAHQQTMPEALQRGVDGVTQVYLGVVGYLESRGHWHSAQELLQWVQQTVEKQSLAEATTLFKLGAFAFRLAQYEQAEHYLAASKTISDTLPPASAVTWLQAYMSEFMARLQMEHDSEDALSWLDEGVAALETIGTPAAAQQQGYLHLIRSEVLGRMLGLMDAAFTAAETGLTLLPNEPTSAHLTALTNLSVIYALKGNLVQSNQCIDEGIPIAEALGDTRRLATMLMNRAINGQKEARLQEAVVDLERAREIFERIGDADRAGSVWVNLGMIYTIWADNAEAIRCLQAAIQLATRHNIPSLEAYAKTTLVRPYLHHGQLAAAAAAADESFALCRQHRYPDLSAIALTWQAWLLHLQGNSPSGLKLMEQAVGLAEGSRLPQETGIARSLQGQILDANRAFDAAERAHRQALALLEEQDRYELALAQLAFVQHCWLRGARPLPQEIADLLAVVRASLRALDATRELAAVDALFAENSAGGK